MSVPTETRFLLSGASGMLGRALRAELVGRDSRVVQLVRRAPAEGEVRWEPADASPFGEFYPLERFDAAIALSGAQLAQQRWDEAFLREMRESRVGTTRALSTWLARLEQPPRVLLVASAVGIYGDRGDAVLDEASTPGTGILPDLCQAWEAAAEPAVAAGIRVVHLRFGVVLHRSAGALSKMLPVFRLGLGGRLGNGRQWMSWIGLPDLVAAVLFCVEKESLAGPVNLVAPGAVTNAEFTRTLAARLGRPAMFPVPAFALRMALGRMADEALLASARAVPRKLTAAGFAFREPELGQALASALG